MALQRSQHHLSVDLFDGRPGPDRTVRHRFGSAEYCKLLCNGSILRLIPDRPEVSVRRLSRDQNTIETSIPRQAAAAKAPLPVGRLPNREEAVPSEARRPGFGNFHREAADALFGS
jgi:hypothetical protein